MELGIGPRSGSESIAVEISDRQGRLPIDPDRLSSLARRVLKGEGIAEASISIVLADDATIHEINRRHLGHDWPTDVVTFRLSDPDDPLLEAELILSAELAATTAHEAGTDFHAELALYLVHGLLHLCGYDDLTPEDAAAMRRREGEVLAAAGLPNTYSSVAAASGREGRP
jgi:probable rRNA maturation factor